MSDLPDGWTSRVSSSTGIFSVNICIVNIYGFYNVLSFKGRTYYVNMATGQSQWEKPEAGEQVRCSHLLVKHAGSRRPSSWREQNITRSKQEALQILNGSYETVLL